MHLGGVYLDTDVWVLRPLMPLMRNELSMGYEDSGRLTNAFMVSRPWCPFLLLWYSMYYDFSPGEWAEHSVALPGHIARVCPRWVHTEERSLMRPSYFETNILYDEHSAFTFENNMVVHLWNHRVRVDLTVCWVLTHGSPVARLARQELLTEPFFRAFNFTCN